MADRMIRWGIIGCGDVCEVKSGPAFYKCDHSSLVAVMRRDAQKAADFAARHRVPKWYTNADNLINDPEVDAVYVATPPEAHAEMAIKVMQAGKPVYVEKPMGRNYAECLEMIRIAEKFKQKLWVAYYRRSLPYFLKVKELIENRCIGTVQTVHITYFRSPLPSDLQSDKHSWRVNKQVAGGGYFYDMASHTIDILMFMLGDITKASGITGNTEKLYEVEDTVSASFLFESGVIGSGIWSYASSKTAEKDKIEICGDKGCIIFSTFEFSEIEWITENSVEKFDLPKPDHIQQPMIQSIVNEISGNGICPSTGTSGARTNWVIDQLFKS